MIYLDSAATTFQKPPAVGRAMTEALASMSSPGRGGHPLAMRAADTAFRCRTELAELFGLDGPEGVAFTLNATHALNIAIKSLVPPGRRVVISGYEHNAVTRPLTALKTKVSVAGGPLFDQEAAIRAFDELIAPGVDVVICNHVSNVFGFVQPVEKVAALCRSRGVPLIVDASQSAGILPINMKSLGAAYIAMPGHKGLYGPTGHRRAPVRGRSDPKTAAGGRHGEYFSQSGDAGLPAGPLRGRDSQYAGDRRPAGGRSLCPPTGDTRPFCAMNTP